MKTLLIYHNVDGFAVQLKNHIEDALTELEIEWKECYIEDVEKVSEEFKPTMHLFFHPNKKIYDYLNVIKNLKGHKLVWSMEDPYESDLTFDLAPYFYYIFTSDENTANKLKEEFPTNNIQYVPHAYNPKVHHPEEASFTYRSDIVFVGNAYESRLEWFSNHANEYKDKLVTIVGVGYRGLDGYQNQRIIHGHISEEEMVKYINGAKLVLNLHRQNSDLDMANKREIQPTSFNNRYYEVIACQKKQLVVGRGEEFYTEIIPTNDADTYKTRLIKYYLPLLKK